MAYTLQDFARLADSDLKRGVIDVFRRESFVMDILPIENSDTLSLQVMRTKDLPTVAFRKIGSSFSESKGTFEPVEENVYDMGGYIDVDKLLDKSKSIVNQRALQADMFVTSLAYNFNDYFINGDPIVDADGLVGMWYRIKNHVSGQEINAGGLDVSPDATSLAANQVKLMDYIMQLIHSIEGHGADACWMNDTMYLRLMSALRAAGLYDTTQDNYARTVSTYGPGGPWLYDIGVKSDQSTKIIGNVEATNGTAKTGGTATSIYANKFGEKYLQGFQLYDIDVEDIGLLESGVAYRTVVDWPLGLYMVNPRSIGQLSGVVAA